MSEHITYVANGGQTYQPCQDNVNVPFAAYEKPANRIHYCRNLN